MLGPSILSSLRCVSYICFYYISGTQSLMFSSHRNTMMVLRFSTLGTLPIGTAFISVRSATFLLNSSLLLRKKNRICIEVRPRGFSDDHISDATDAGTYFSMPEWWDDCISDISLKLRWWSTRLCFRYNPDYAPYGRGDWPGGLARNPFNSSELEPYTGRLNINDYLDDLQLPQMLDLVELYDSDIMVITSHLNSFQI